MGENMKTYKVYAIQDGTVIDHIPSTKALKVVDILGLENEGILTIGIGFSSKKMGKKDIIKIEHKFLQKEETDRISLIAPHATINIIRNGELAEKRKIELPEEYINIVKCPNPNCMTSRSSVKSRFSTVQRDPLVLRCRYCERLLRAGDVELI
jgi:aspartate carbamoyltransferase regulatory subunit